MKLSKKIIAALMITTVFSSNYYTYAAQLDSTNQFTKVDINYAINYADQLHNKVVKINDDSSLEALCKSDTDINVNSLPNISIVDKSNSDTTDLIYAVSNLVESGHTITPTYTGLPSKKYVDDKIAAATNAAVILKGTLGTGGTITGVGQYLKSKNPNIKVIGIEPSSSPFLTKGISGVHGLQGIGAGFIPPLINLEDIQKIIHLKNHMKANSEYDNRSLDWVAYIAGRRESRRLMGDYILKQHVCNFRSSSAFRNNYNVCGVAFSDTEHILTETDNNKGKNN